MQYAHILSLNEPNTHSTQNRNILKRKQVGNEQRKRDARQGRRWKDVGQVKVEGSRGNAADKL